MDTATLPLINTLSLQNCSPSVVTLIGTIDHAEDVIHDTGTK